MDYSGSTPTSDQNCENPFNPPTSTHRFQHWKTQAFTQGEPSLVNDLIVISSDTSLFLPEILSLPSTPSTISQTPTTTFPLNLPTKLDDRYREHLTSNIPLRLDWNTFVATTPLFGQHHHSNRLHNWALNRLQYRHDIHKDIQEHNIQIIIQDNLTLKFEITVKINRLVDRPHPPRSTKYNSSIITSPIYHNRNYL